MKKNLSKYILGGLFLATIGYVFYSNIENKKTEKITPDTKFIEKEKASNKKNTPRFVTSKKQETISDFPDAEETENLSENVQKLLDENLNFRDRFGAVHALSKLLSNNDRAALYNYLKNGKNNKNAYVLKNDILNALRDQKVPPKELTNVMLDIFYDKNQDIVVRSYVLQHMRPWYLDERQKDAAIVQAFYDGLKETDNEIAGVALLALRYLSEQAPTEFDKELISSRAAVIAENENTYILTRISAVGVCGKMNSSQSLPVIRKLAENNSSVSLRVAAIASLGEIGDSSDLPFLRRVSTEKRPFSIAAKTAIKKLYNKY